MERFGPLRELTQVWFRRSTQPRPPFARLTRISRPTILVT